MTRLNHGRPMFKAIDAGGGERIRTVGEELSATRRLRTGEAAKASNCGSCGARKKVTGATPRCPACHTDEATIRSAKKKLRALAELKAQGRVRPESPLGLQFRDRIAAAEARIASRAKKNGFTPQTRTQQTRSRTGVRKPAASGSAALQRAERAVEAARKERLLARTDFEVQILRGRLARAQQELARMQLEDRSRRSLR
ncbi:MAG: hypothetical protein JWO67_6785 [Streptosporangiaceae bacterium]|nr:hypothetical protein [Streptosporangiaceae bacterium]